MGLLDSISAWHPVHESYRAELARACSFFDAIETECDGPSRRTLLGPNKSIYETIKEYTKKIVGYFSR